MGAATVENQRARHNPTKRPTVPTFTSREHEDVIPTMHPSRPANKTQSPARQNCVRTEAQQRRRRNIFCHQANDEAKDLGGLPGIKSQSSHRRIGNRAGPSRISLTALIWKPLLVIPSHGNAVEKACYPRRIYRRRHKIENFLCRIKDWRRIATRCDKLAHNFLAANNLVATLYWIKL